LCAVNLAAITVAADKNLSLAARAQKQPASRRRRRQQRTWTRSTMTGILPRHACSARCGARRRSETWPLRSAPCRPRQSGKFLPRAKQVAQAAILRARKPVDLWTTRRGVAHKPTGPTTAADNLNLEISSVRTTPGSHSQDPHATLPPSKRGSCQPFTPRNGESRDDLGSLFHCLLRIFAPRDAGVWCIPDGVFENGGPDDAISHLYRYDHLAKWSFPVAQRRKFRAPIDARK
jgi:hypothetical protein